jgi:hypothetical protein
MPDPKNRHPKVAAPSETVVRRTNLGPLHSLMLRACKPDEQGTQSITILAERIKCTRASLYKIIERGRVSPFVAMDIVEQSEGRVSLDDFHPYVYVR